MNINDVYKECKWMLDECKDEAERVKMKALFNELLKRLDSKKGQSFFGKIGGMAKNIEDNADKEFGGFING